MATERRRENDRSHAEEMSDLEQKMSLKASEDAAEDSKQRSAAIDEVCGICQ